MIAWVIRHRWHLLLVALLVAAMAIVRARASRHEVFVSEAYSGPLHLRIAASGLVENDSTDLAFQVGGEVVRLYVQEGDAVRATDLLARLSSLDTPFGSTGAADTIQAPYHGTVVHIYLREGSVVAPGQPVLRLVSAARPWVTAFINGEDAIHIRPGQRLNCRAGGYLTEAWEIVARAVGREALPRPDLPGSSRQVRVRCDVVDPAFPLAPGTEVDVDGEALLADNALLVPTTTVVHEGADDWIWVVEDERVHRREVELGPNNFEFIQIRRGLDPGELVVVRGKQGLSEGQRVKARPLAPPTTQ